MIFLHWVYRSAFDLGSTFFDEVHDIPCTYTRNATPTNYMNVQSLGYKLFAEKFFRKVNC